MRRKLAWLAYQIGWFTGNIACLLMLVLFLPLVPVFKAFDDVRSAHEDD